MSDQPANLQPVLLSADEAARLLGISRRHLQAMDRSGRLGPRSIPLGRCRRWIRVELENWAAAGCPSRSEWISSRSIEGPGI